MSFDRAFQTPQWVIGLMSGTSADGVDGALLRVSAHGIHEFGPTLYHPYSQHMRQRILRAMGESAASDANLEQDLTNEHTVLTRALIEQSGIRPVLIGFHGQTLYHRPRRHGHKAKTMQIGDASALASELKIPVVAQFRAEDVAAGGEGAPFVPIFHYVFLEGKLTQEELETCAVANIGGVCNITLLGSEITAGDVGPGCCLLDDWGRQKAMSYNDFSALAERGQADEHILQKWLSTPFFMGSLPKSADRMQWHPFLSDIATLSPEDAAATLAGLTVMALVQALPSNIQILCVTGGGRHHDCLMTPLEKSHGAVKIDDFGCSGDFLEAYAFALLAMRSVLGLPLSFPGTTGVPLPISGGRLYGT